MAYFPPSWSIIGDEGLNCCVRDGPPAFLPISLSINLEYGKAGGRGTGVAPSLESPEGVISHPRDNRPPATSYQQ